MCWGNNILDSVKKNNTLKPKLLLYFSGTCGIYKYKVSQKKVWITTCNGSSNSHFFLGHLVVGGKFSLQLLLRCIDISNIA